MTEDQQVATLRERWEVEAETDEGSAVIDEYVTVHRPALEKLIALASYQQGYVTAAASYLDDNYAAGLGKLAAEWRLQLTAVLESL